MLAIIILQVANPANITNFKKGEIIKTTPFEMVLIIRVSMKKTITLALAFLLLFSTFVVSAAPEISYDGTSVIVKGTVENANAENPVAIIIVNPAADGSERTQEDYAIRYGKWH